MGITLVLFVNSVAIADTSKPLSVKTPAEGTVFDDDIVEKALEQPVARVAKPKLVPAYGTVRVGRDRFEVLWSAPGKIAAKRPGEYDKARDVRRPDRFVWLDAIQGKVLSEREIEDPVSLLRIGQLHAAHPGLGAFVHMSPDTKWLRVVDGDVEWELTLERPLAKYDPETLRHQRVDDGRLLVSITVDPVNREAVARQKADADEIDFYLVDLSTKKATRVLVLDGQKRPSTWRWRAGKLALLRKSKNFSTGGVALEIYALALGESAPR